MSSHAADAGEGSHGDEESAAHSQNAVACDALAAQQQDVATPSSPSDSKRSDAARLARELGSSSPWSEALMPQTHGSMPQPSPINADLNVRQENENINQSTTQVEQDLDPPPAYSRSPHTNEFPHIYELPVDNMNPEQSATPVMRDQDEVQPPLDADIEQNQAAEEAGPTTETPLLARPLSSRGTVGRCRRWMERGKTSRRRLCRLSCAVVFFSIIAMILVGLVALTDDGSGISFLHRPPGPAQPLVPTGPDYRRHETVEDITGSYKLYDRIELTTTTGSINVEIEPQAGDNPAVVILSSEFGSITLRVPTAYLNRRNRIQRTFHTEIKSFAGNVAADILIGHGGHALVDTTAGAQDLFVLSSAVSNDDEKSNLTTLSKTGTQKIVLSSLDRPNKPISNLRAEHHALGTASVDVTYPAAWMGEVRVFAAPFGAVSASGNGLKYSRQDQDTIVARRGSSKRPTLVEVISEGTGSASFKC